MAWTVRVEDENGKVVSESFVIVEVGSLPRGVSFPILSLIEAAPYYDTVLNPVQTKAMIEELKRSTMESLSSYSSLIDLATRALVAQHCYLRFVGD